MLLSPMHKRQAIKNYMLLVMLLLLVAIFFGVALIHFVI